MTKEYTPQQKARKKYEIIHKEERKQATRQYNTRLPVDEFNNISQFLKKYGIAKVDLIRVGFIALKKEYEKEEILC